MGPSSDSIIWMEEHPHATLIPWEALRSSLALLAQPAYVGVMSRDRWALILRGCKACPFITVL